MAEPADLIFPILQKIQADIADGRRSLEAKINDVAEMTLESREKLDAIEGYLTYNLGVTSRTVADVEGLKASIAEMLRRIEALEARPS